MTMNERRSLLGRMLFGRIMCIAAGLCLTACLLLPCGTALGAAPEDMARAPLSEPLGQQGTITFQIKTGKEYHTGSGANPITVDILEIPEVATLQFKQASTVCELQWMWARGIRADDLSVEIPQLAGPEEFFVQYTWDAPAGRFTGYVNGTALRLPETVVTPFELPEAQEILLAGAPFQVELFSSQARYLEESEARAEVPETLLGRHAGLFGGAEKLPAPMDVMARMGQPLYESALDSPESVDGWVMEGPGLTSFEEGWMEVASKKPDSLLKDGHIVYWCPEDFPESFVAEWEVQIESEDGLCIVFFAASGAQGEDLFDPGLPKRTGIFKQYTQGAISCYHISYYANTPSAQGRITSNMRKNSGFYLVSNGPPGIAPGSKEAHTVCLIKDKGHVQMQIDGNTVIDFIDDGERYGPVHGAGKIGFRQMQWTVARYRDLRVHALLPESAARTPALNDEPAN